MLQACDVTAFSSVLKSRGAGAALAYLNEGVVQPLPDGKAASLLRKALREASSCRWIRTSRTGATSTRRSSHRSCAGRFSVTLATRQCMTSRWTRRGSACCPASPRMCSSASRRTTLDRRRLRCATASALHRAVRKRSTSPIAAPADTSRPGSTRPTAARRAGLGQQWKSQRASG